MAYDANGYYSRSVRDGHRVRRVYLGKGPTAQLAALLDEQRRCERQARSLAWRVQESDRENAEGRLRELNELSGLMTRATLLAAGFHRRDRGSWRRWRVHGNGAMNGMDLDPGATHVDGAPVPGEGPARGDGPQKVDGCGPGNRPLSEGELRELLGRAEQGDRTVLPALRRLLDASPNLWKYCGDVARTAEAAWVDLIAGQNLLVRESLTRKVAALKIELAGPSAPLLERLLAERVAVCWMQAAQADAAFAQLKGKSLTAAQLDLLQRRQERTQRSYVAAIKAVATVRRLVAPAPAAAEGRIKRENGAGDSPRSGAKRRYRRATTGAGEPIGACEGARGSARKKREKARPGDSMPEPLRDRMRSLVGSEN